MSDPELKYWPCHSFQLCQCQTPSKPHVVAVPAAQYGPAEREECQHAHDPTDTSGGETGVSISREDWDREDCVGCPHIFLSIVNYFLAEAFYSWLCSFVFMLGIVLIVKGHGILSGKLVKAQPRGWSMNSNSQLHTAHAW